MTASIHPTCECAQGSAVMPVAHIYEAAYEIQIIRQSGISKSREVGYRQPHFTSNPSHFVCSAPPMTCLLSFSLLKANFT